MHNFIPKKFKIDYLLKDKQLIEKYGIKLKIHSLKGHTTGSIGIEYKDYLFVGDALVNIFKVTPAYQNQNTKDAKRSSQKIKHLSPKITFLGHDKEILQEKLLKDLN